jgi:hypothetical protein
VISDRSKQNLELAFHRAARESLVRNPSDACDISPAQSDLPAEQLSGEVLLITISSFAFRLLTIFYVANTPAARAYYFKDSGDQRICEVFAEVANLCCGAFNRELAHSFSHLAMSIPYTLSGQCMVFLDELKPQYLSSYGITINDSVQVRATLCMHCSAPVDVVVSAARLEDNSGALELF